MTEQDQRERVETEARTWLRTPYRHHARLLGKGVDCAQLPAAVYEAAGMVPHLEPRYVREWHLHRSEEMYVDWALRYAREIPREQAGRGDLGLWRYGRTFSHGVIVLSPELGIHARIGAGVELVDLMRDEDLRPGGREARFFTLWGA